MRFAVPDGAGRRCAALADALDIPVPFVMGRFCAALERQLNRALHVVPVSFGPSVPCGLWLAAADADYIYYDRQASPTHQTHIVFRGIAHMLIGHQGVSRSLVPTLAPEVTQLMLGSAPAGREADREAETLAFLIFERACGLPLPAGWAKRSCRQLRPLQAVLRQAIPAKGCALLQGTRQTPTLRLCRRVIEIRDRQLALVAYRDQDVAEATAEQARSAGLAGHERDAAVEAAVLRAALNARRRGDRPLRHATPRPGAAHPRLDLASETAFLVRVSQALNGRIAVTGGRNGAGDPGR